MVVALLLAMLFQAGTGLFTNDDILNDGPLVKHISKDLSDSISYAASARLVGRGRPGRPAHRRGGLVLCGAFKDDLVRPMIHGRKTLPPSAADPAAAAASTRRGRWRCSLRARR